MVYAVIVEDDPMVMEINRQYLEKIDGIRVVACFRNGRDALAYLQKGRADLIIMDFYMPEMTGLEVLRQLRINGNSADVIMVTADNTASDIKSVMSLGVSDYLIKPFEFERFRQSVEKCVARHRLISAEDNEKEQLSQEEIDRLMQSDLGSRNQEESRNAQLDKGINANTLEVLLNSLKYVQDEDIDCETLSARSGLSKVTVRRYMNYLIENDQAESVIDYNTGGRPAIRYRYKK